jgi:transcriptional regulator with XRE-family HTH domain
MSNILHSQDNSPRPQILEHLSENLKRIRTSGGISQSKLATEAGLSRRMIAAIENGAANVSLATIDRLARALGVTFTVLVRPPFARDNARIEALGWKGNSSQSQAILLGAAPATRETELWVWSLAPGETYESETGSENWHEMLLVLKGQLSLTRAGASELVQAEDFRIFSTSEPYRFSNQGAENLTFVRLIVL